MSSGGRGPSTHVVSHGPGGTSVVRTHGGDVRTVHGRGGVVVSHGPGSVRRSEVVRRDGSVVVARGGGRMGYVQRPYMVRGNAFVNRTYYYHGTAYARYYRPYVFRGVALNVYVPGRYYSPGFYGWAYSPWVVPVRYRWGWYGNPWYAYYGGFFTPYPVYSSPSLWLTDYLVAATLEQAYEERMAAGPPQPLERPVAMTADVKQAIADEVQRQLALERSQGQAGANAIPDPSQSGLPQMLADGASHVFIVSSSLFVTSGGQECAVTEGDVLQLTSAPSQDSSTADLRVLASKGQDCPKGSVVAVALQDLQEMQNHMRETIDRGLGDLEKHEGGLPAPPSGPAPVQASFAALAPPPDPNIASELTQTASEASRAEQEVVSQALSPQGGGAPMQQQSQGPGTISLGQSPEQVVAILGTPKNIVNLGAKKMYLYKDMKITFSSGRVTDVE